jgi:NitT/TauT family transport system permease protein
MSKRNKNIGIYIILIVVLLVLWQISSSNNIVRLLISSPQFIVEYFSENYSSLLSATGITLFEAFIGLIIATSFSFLIMIVCFYKPVIMEFILPVMVTSQVIPLIVLAPFFIILLGIGVTSKIAMAAVMCFFPTFINFATGYRSINQNIHDLMSIYNAKKSFLIFKVYFPLSLPNIMTGLKISATLSVIGAIVAEFSGADVGIGKNLFISAIRLEPDLMMSSLVLSALLGGIIYSLIISVEKFVGKWYLKGDFYNAK